MKATRFLVLIAIAILVAGCGGGGGTNTGSGTPPSTTTQGSAVLSINLIKPAITTLGIGDVGKIRIKVMANQVNLMTDTFSYTAGSSVVRTLVLYPGTYTFVVDALRADGITVEFTGTSAPATIVAGQSTSVSVTLEPPKTGVDVGVTIHGDLGPPTIVFTKVPPYGVPSDTVLYGKVTGVLPGTCKVMVWIKVSGSWWVKPRWNNMFTAIQADGTWACQTYTGGYDYNATEMRAYLVTNDYRSGSMPPTPPTAQSLAMVSVTR